MVLVRFHQSKVCRYFGLKLYLMKEETSVTNGQIKLVVEGFLDLLLACSIDFVVAFYRTEQLPDSSVERLNLVLMVGYLVILLLLPLLAFCLLVREKEPSNFLLVHLHEILTQDNRTDSTQARLYMFYFLTRRLFMVLTLVLLDNLHTIQCQLIFALSGINLAYLIRVKPLPTRFDNQVEIFNEGTLYAASFILILFCNVSWAETQIDNVGIGFIFLVASNFLVNMIITLAQSILPAISDFKS